jgi:hypothetical protein
MTSAEASATFANGRLGAYPRDVGLRYDVIKFPAKPPSREELIKHLRAEGPGTWAFDSYTVHGHRAELLCSTSGGGAVTRDYALAFLLGQGGTRVDPTTGEPVAVALPAYVMRRWRSLGWWKRMRIYLLPPGADRM